MLKTWGSIIELARGELWPFPGESKPQIAAHTKYFHLAAMDLQHWIPELQVRNATIYPFCATFFDCGKTVIKDAPVGLIQRLYTVIGDDFCDRVNYRGVEFCEVDCWSRNLLTYTPPDQTGLDPLPMGFRYADASSDSTCGRSRTGIWARHRNSIYVAPWIQSNESVVVEWDGVKKEWLLEDALETDLWDDRVMNAVKMFVLWYHEKFFGCDHDKKLSLERDYNNERADLMHYFAEITKARGAEVCCDDRLPTSAELADDADSVDEEPLVLAAMGDYGGDNDDRDDVAGLIDAWEPSYVVTLGDNWYGDVSTLADLIARNGEVYEQYLEDGKFIPTLGNHDRTPPGHLAIELAHFKFPELITAHGPEPSTGYYSKVIDQRVEIFVYDSGYRSISAGGENQQADGVDVNSKQAAWLRVALARSTSKWKIVTMHHPPYSSKESGVDDDAPIIAQNGWLEYAQLQLPFKAWGADIVLTGHVHAYERLEKDGFPYVIVGTGGFDIDDGFNVNNLSPWNQAYDVDHFGALKITVTCDTLKTEFFDTDGELHDTLELSK